MTQTCPHCHARNEAKNRYCGQCGRPLAAEYAQTEIAMPPVRPVAKPSGDPSTKTGRSKKPAAAGRIRFANGGTLELSGNQEFFVGRADLPSGWSPAIDLSPHGGEAGGVSRKHARLFFKGGLPYAEDLNSTNGTFVNETRLPAHTPRRIKHGDTLRFGRVQVHFTYNENGKAS
jgi:pSer/pThr/pTyr-binding forkhead associated (FHA) protein